eukprot:359295-Chlamydomonas_euryale.AAC.5
MRYLLRCPWGLAPAFNVNRAGSCPFGITSMPLFDGDCFMSIASQVFVDGKTAFAQNPKSSTSAACIESDHPARRLAGQYQKNGIGIESSALRPDSLCPWRSDLP